MSPRPRFTSRIDVVRNAVLGVVLRPFGWFSPNSQFAIGFSALVLSTTLTFIPSLFEVATGDPRLAGAIVDVDSATGRATAIRRVMLDEAGLQSLQPV